MLVRIDHLLIAVLIKNSLRMDNFSQKMIQLHGTESFFESLFAETNLQQSHDQVHLALLQELQANTDVVEDDFGVAPFSPNFFMSVPASIVCGSLWTGIIPFVTGNIVANNLLPLLHRESVDDHPSCRNLFKNTIISKI